MSTTVKPLEMCKNSSSMSLFTAIPSPTEQSSSVELEFHLLVSKNPLHDTINRAQLILVKEVDVIAAELEQL